MKRETLTLPVTEVRLANDGASGVISGYAAVFGELIPDFNEIVKRGAFTRTLQEHRTAGTKPVMLWAHNPAEPIGSWSEFTEDERGLKVTGQIVLETAKGREALALLNKDAIRGLSMGFVTRKSERSPTGVRVLTDVQLMEISLVTFQAAPSALITSVRHSAAPHSVRAFTQAASRAAHSIRGLK